VSKGGGCPVGLVIAPVLPIESWQLHYSRLFDAIGAAMSCDLTFD